MLVADKDKSIEAIAGHILWELVGDFDNKYAGLEDTYYDVSIIAELAIEISDSYYKLDNADEYFNQIVYLIRHLSPDAHD